MINTLARLDNLKGTRPFFRIHEEADTVAFSYRQTRLAAAALAKGLAERGVTEGTYVACSMFNCAEFVFLTLAAAYGGFTLAVLNPRHSDEERHLRLVELEGSIEQQGIAVLEERDVEAILLATIGMGVRDIPAFSNGSVPVRPNVMEALDYAAQREAAFRTSNVGVVMFTSGTSGTPKATQLTWRGLMGSAQAANRVLSQPGKGVWQLVLPMCHVGGFQIFMRSLLNENPFILYTHFNPKLILNDVLSFKVTHVSVVNRILTELLENDTDRVIQQYQCLLLGGAAPDKQTIKRALRQKANVWVSYGMTETASFIAAAPLTKRFDGGMHLLPGYEVNIMNPDAQGVGELQVKGPGLFKGYLNARSASTLEGYFDTGDRARMTREGLLYVYERSDDLIISGGENIYPAEVREVLLQTPGVKDAYVFGTADEQWGYRPVAFIEANYSAESLAASHKLLGLDPEETGLRPATCPQEFARSLHAYLETRMSSLNHPKHILVVDRLPRTTIGKVDAGALKRRYDKRIDIKSINLYRVKQPFNTPVKTARAEVRERESFFVEVVDWAGRTGIAECVAFSTDWYLPETCAQDYEVVRSSISKVVLNERYLHPSEVSRSLATFPALAPYPLAKAAVEPAIWDLYGKIMGQPLADLIGGQADVTHVLGGTVIGIKSTEETLAAVQAAVDAGYQRVKIKISPESSLEKIRAVRDAYPNVQIILDANQSFTEEHYDLLYKFNDLDITCIEEPLDPNYVPVSGERDIFWRLEELQSHITTPICLDESVVTGEDMSRAMSHKALTHYTLKIAKFGGIQPALDFYQWARANGKTVWMGGMFDTGVSKRMMAAFETLPGVDIPGDISDATCYFAEDVAVPKLALTDGQLAVRGEGYGLGLGCRLDKDYLERLGARVVSVVQ